MCPPLGPCILPIGFGPNFSPGLGAGFHPPALEQLWKEGRREHWEEERRGELWREEGRRELWGGESYLGLTQRC